MSSAEVKPIVPEVVSDVSELLLGLPSAISPEPAERRRGGRPASLTVVEARPGAGMLSVGVESPIEMVSVACDRSPSPSLIV